MQANPAPTICLAMIARDEAHIIRRCLDSVSPYIDHWIVCDTGSIDTTCIVTRAYFRDRGIPGKVLHHPWQNFAHNRTLATQAAAQTGCDYTLVIDADETLIVADPSVLAGLSADAYRVEMQFPGVSYPRVNLMRSALTWRYVSPIHEYATCVPPVPEVLLDPARIHMWTDGQGARGRSADKTARDLAVMQQWVHDEPDNPRAWFYLAQAYETTNRLMEAIAAYTKRVALGDYLEEVWYSHYRMGKLCDYAHNWPAAQLHYLDAYHCQPRRGEPLYWLAIGHHNRQQDHAAMLYLEAISELDKPTGSLFVEDAVYDYLRWIAYCTSLYNTGEQDDARALAGRVLAAGKIPETNRPVLERIAGTVLVEA
jgi:glycosyltransferase involved in cell wall biosynthesis